MITEFTDRRPAFSAVLIVLLFTAVPGAFLFFAERLPALGENAAKIVFVYALLLQLILLFKVERPILIAIPFILALLGFIVSEIVYTVSMSAAPIGAGPSPIVYLFSAALVTLFGIVASASIGGLLIYVILVIARKIREAMANR